MTLNLNVPTLKSDLSPRITVIGVGGAGGNAVNNMIQSNLEGVEFLIANTDAQAINGSNCERCIQLGRNITQGLGAGSRPDIGRAAAEEAMDEILGHLEGSNMVFITAGMGGGTGTGAAPVIARAARESGILTVGVVTKPFHFEGVHRMRLAEAGIADMTQYVDTLIIIPNQNLFRIANEKTTFADAFKMADDVLKSGVSGVTDLMVMPGLINLDFADIRAVMTEMGKAMMGTGEAEGETRAIDAAEAAISNPLLDEVSMKGARGVLINITGGPDLTLFEVDEAANRIRDEVDPDANIIFGSTFEPTLDGKMRVSVVATGIDIDEAAAPRPAPISLVSARAETVKTDTAATPAPAAAVSIASAPVAAMPAVSSAPYASAAATAQVADYEPELESQLFDEPEQTSADPFEMPEPIEQESIAQPVTDSFMAPAPVTAEDAPAPQMEQPVPVSPEPQAPTRQTIEPSAEVSAEAAAPATPKRPRGLFAKMTGAARALNAGKPLSPTSSPVSRPAMTESPMASSPQPTPMPPMPQPQQSLPSSPAATPAAPATAQTDQQPRLSGLDPAERIGTRQTDEDLLDIPAFLRRQAN
ncbi:cell division protein FtsZ [Denitrobaculum tricleocarpae]|uniref:Cell division protein FtsZ n=1 Tax=Denitrobaculum tricleocarpae TaxID=2591009 RepID=A0A545T0U0_9PROT|nr:cell division protein FtsZ [Denitrobaculum tricleocarpae]TQV70826.1 cell division protein FtsZ [Denitrobaculum tricleocarpae]